MKISIYRINIKTYSFFLILLIFVLACSSDKNKNEIRVSNGIDQDILNLVDSLCFISKDTSKFVTISCSSYNDTSDYLNISKGLLYLTKCYTLKISECPFFIGYKKYNNLYLVFYDTSNKGSIYEFINKDSLAVDEFPFQSSYNQSISSKNIDPIAGDIWQMNFQIRGIDSLVFLNNGFPPPY